MDIFVFIVALICGILGMLGTFLPVVPGPPLSYAGILLIYWRGLDNYSHTFLWVFGLLTLLVSILDYFAPVWLTNRFGGSKYATNGSLIGMVAGIFFFPPFGMIFGPFIGAFIGELMANKNTVKAFKIATVSFGAFLLSTGLKLILSGIMLFYIIASIF
ncbi:MAG: DUF456 domain-containing protein [Bacteroidales bacterium]